MLEALYPPEVVTVEAPIGDVAGPLLVSEEACVRRVAPKRRREFATGRDCARRALARLGIEEYPLLPGENRCPSWPAGIVGCISHSDEYCAVAVARSGSIVSLGLDLEPDEPLDAELWPLVLTAAEIEGLERLPVSERGRRARLLFSAKECAYKCQFPAFGEPWEFEDLEVAVDAHGAFGARVKRTGRTGKLAGATLRGRYRVEGDRIVTAMVLAGS